MAPSNDARLKYSCAVDHTRITAHARFMVVALKYHPTLDDVTTFISAILRSSVFIKDTDFIEDADFQLSPRSRLVENSREILRAFACERHKRRHGDSLMSTTTTMTTTTTTTTTARRCRPTSSSRTPRNYTVTLPAHFDVTRGGAGARARLHCRHTFSAAVFFRQRKVLRRARTASISVERGKS